MSPFDFIVQLTNLRHFDHVDPSQTIQFMPDIGAVFFSVLAFKLAQYYLYVFHMSQAIKVLSRLLALSIVYIELRIDALKVRENTYQSK